MAPHRDLEMIGLHYGSFGGRSAPMPLKISEFKVQGIRNIQSGLQLSYLHFSSSSMLFVDWLKHHDVILIHLDFLGRRFENPAALFIFYFLKAFCHLENE